MASESDGPLLSDEEIKAHFPPLGRTCDFRKVHQDIARKAAIKALEWAKSEIDWTMESIDQRLAISDKLKEIRDES